MDDEPNVLSGLRRMLRGRAVDWQMEFAGGGQQALDVMAQKPFDVIVTDMRMPGIDGPALLAQVKTRWPEVVRIVLSGHSDSESVMRSVHEAHQYLSKPCSAERLEQTIDRSLGLRSILCNHQLLALVSAIDQLPTLPTSYQEIIGALREQKLSVRDLGSLVERDIGLSAKVLQLVNSAFFGTPRHISSPGDAAVLLGVDVLSALVLGSKLFSLDEADAVGAAHLQLLSLGAVHVAATAKRIALDLGAEVRCADQAFLSGILHDLGNLVLLCHRRADYIRLQAEKHSDPAAVSRLERETFGATHGEIGAYLLGLWGFDDDVVEAVVFHHEPPSNLPTNLRPLVALHVAVSLVEGLPPAPDARIVSELHLEQRLPAWRSATASTGEPSCTESS